MDKDVHCQAAAWLESLVHVKEW